MLYTKYKKQFFIILTILWTFIIFSFSLQSGEDSSEISSGFGAWLMEHVLSVFSIDDMSTEQLDSFHFLIRKCAHFTEFFILGVFMYLTLKQTTIIHKAGIGIVLCMVVAAMDETIQLFMDGRSGQLTDVLLDSCGGLVGIWVAYLIASRVKRCV